MREHLFLCGFKEAKLEQTSVGRALELRGPNKNVRLSVDGLRKRLLGVEVARLTDYMDIAAYVFAADRLTSRGGDTFENMGQTWRRDMRLKIAVRELDFWQRPDVQNAIVEALSFLTDDSWAFEFVKSETNELLQGTFDFAEPNESTTGDASIVLFSGGLDSFSGAVHELRTTNRRVVLLSHKNANVMAGRQIELARALQEAYPRRILHAGIGQGLAGGSSDREFTQRTRTFFFAAIASIAVALERADRVRFFENGIMSSNLPISGQVVGTKASRSTHPRSLQLLERLVNIVLDRPIVVDNPFIWMTKAEVVADLAITKFRQHIARTISCSRSREVNPIHPHCGVCAQCLQRRISTIGGGAADADPAVDYAVDFLLGERTDGPDRAMAVSTVSRALELHRLSDTEIARRFAGELGTVVQGFPNLSAPDTARRFASLFKKQGDAVLRIVSGAIRDHSEQLALGQVSGGSVLRLVLDGGHLPASSGPAPVPPAADADTAIEEEALEEITLRINPDTKRVTVVDVVEFNSASEYKILCALAATFREDREAERPAKEFRVQLGKHLADIAELSSEDAVRQCIRRIRKEFREAMRRLYRTDPDEDALIQNRRGYRLNPKVRLISPAKLPESRKGSELVTP